MKVCKHCGEINSGDSAFCCNCGNTNFIFQEEIVCHACGGINDKSYTHCINCGANLTEQVTKDSTSDSIDYGMIDTSVANEVANLYGRVSVTPSEIAKCPSCGAEVPLTAIYCNRCGTSVANLHDHRVVQRKVCPQCNRLNPLDAHFCSYCFSSLAEAGTEEMQVVHETQHLGDIAVQQVFLENPDGKKSVCPNCGTLNPKDEEFCQSCGLKLIVDEPKTYCPECGAENPVDTQFCTKCRHAFVTEQPNTKQHWICKECGFANDDEDNYCSKCGKKRKK